MRRFGFTLGDVLEAQFAFTGHIYRADESYARDCDVGRDS